MFLPFSICVKYTFVAVMGQKSECVFSYISVLNFIAKFRRAHLSKGPGGPVPCRYVNKVGFGHACYLLCGEVCM